MNILPDCKKTAFQDFKEHLRAEHRNYWWNLDFVELIAKRINLSPAKKALDVGCGLGHWTRLLYPYLSRDAEMIGIDCESKFLHEAHKITELKLGKNHHVYYTAGDAYFIPFANQTFDLVTCQFTLMHLADVRKAISDMLRVLKSGGILMLVEPNKTTNMLNSNSILDKLSVEEKCDLVKLYLTCEQGKIKNGRGFEDIGARLVSCLTEFDVTIEGVYNTDKAIFLNPPYMDHEQKTLVQFFKNLASTEHFRGYTKEQVWQYFLSIENNENELNRLWKIVEKYNNEFLNQLENKTANGSFASTIIITIAKKQ